MSLLCLVHQGSKLHKAHGRFAIARPEQAIVEVPIRDVEQVLVFGNIQLTTAAISTCLYQQIPVAFLSQTGQYKGQLWSAEHDDLRAEMAQFRRFEDESLQAQMAKSLVTGKLWNSKQLLLKLNRRRNSERVASAIAGLDQDLRKVERLEPLAENLDVLRGLEGASAARYFPALGQLITQPDFGLTHRSRRPPTDPVNSLLSFGYTLLFNNVLSLIRLEGLNPYLGNLHRSDRKEPHLVCDLMEEFRSPIADTLMLALVNQRIVKPDDFTEPNEQGGVYLRDRGRRLFIQAFEKRMSTELTHPDAAKPVTYRRAIQLQIRRYKRCLLEDVPYEPFRRVT